LLTSFADLFYYHIDPNTGDSKTGTFEFGNSSTQSNASAIFTWRQQAGNGSLLLNCYKPQPEAIGSIVAICSAAGGIVPYQWSTADGIVPGGSIKIATDGKSITLGSPVAPGPYQFTVKVTDSAAPQAAIANYFVSGTVPPSPPKFKCSTNRGPTQANVSYTTVCMPSGGTQPYYWSIIEGYLPSGLTLTALENGAVVISGTVSSAGAYQYTLMLRDSFDSAARTARLLFSGTTAPSDPSTMYSDISCTISSTTYAIGLPMKPIGCAISGGIAPYTWSLHSGMLPKGMYLNSTSSNVIFINGIPTEDSYGGEVFLKVIDSSSVPKVRILKLGLGVYEPPDFTCAPTDGQTGEFYTSYCSSFSSVTWVSEGQLPPGLSLFSHGIAGTPTNSGTYPFAISVLNGQYPTVKHSYAITITGQDLPRWRKPPSSPRSKTRPRSNNSH
jgi:hypothetical protein